MPNEHKDMELKIKLFTCANRQCRCLNEKLGLYFFTTDIEKALKHSEENDSPMFISEHTQEAIEGMYASVRKLENFQEEVKEEENE